jgi:predicted nucleic acid-binding protein
VIVYLDACVVIYWVEDHPVHFQRIDTMLATPETRVVSTELCRLECRVQPLRESNPQVLAMYDQFFDGTDLRYVPLDRAVFDLATELRARHGLKAPDALHLAAALEGGCEEFWTSDERLAKAAAGRIALVTFS